MKFISFFDCMLDKLASLQLANPVDSVALINDTHILSQWNLKAVPSHAQMIKN